MINFTENTKNQYKAYERQFSVYGNLYLAEKRLSKNLIDESAYLDINNLTYNNGVFTQIQADTNNNPKVQLQAYNNWTYLYNFSPDEELMQDNNIIYFQFTKTSEFNQVRYKVNGSTIDTAIWFDVSNLENNKTYYIGATFTNKTQGSISWKDIYINEDNSNYEEYGTIVNDYTLFPLTEENECKILEFNINEKTDIYYTSLPYNTMTIKVDNEKGYFTDYDVDSIVNKLNTDCYVDLFIKINEDDYYKIMTMKFDKISSSDYEKATLSFKSSISLLKTLPLRDKYNSLFSQGDIYKDTLINYMQDNYKIKLFCDNTNNIVLSSPVEPSINSIENLIIQSATLYGDIQNAFLTINDSQDRIVYRTWKSYAQDTILLDYQQEKPIIKREDNYRGVRKKYSNIRDFQQSTDTFNYVLNGQLTSENDTIVLRNNDYKINDITINDITYTGLTNLTIGQSVAYEILILNLKGNIGNNYTITINKNNITKKTNENFEQQSIGLVDDTTKILNLNELAPIYINYYNLILNEKQVKSKIEAKIFGLPYLEIGDTVEIETELAKILMTITEIDMNFDGGLIETIRGYELGWDMLFPSDTLYPSDDLYPNRPVD